MNANPFTLGHRYLVETASEQVEKLFVIPVKEDVSLFPYEERLEMIRRGCEGLATVLDGSDYQISAATFPTYFLKDLSEASETQMLLDLDLFGRHIAPALGATVRFVGTEPSDPLTARYNELMKEVLPSYGIQVVEIPRLNGVQASNVRKALEHGSFQTAASMTPPTTWPYLIAELMARALRIELDTPLKPGLVDKDSNGAHSDMDYALMKGSIDVIRRSFIRHLPFLLQRWSTAYEDTATLGMLRGGTGAERSEASGGAERSEAVEPPELAAPVLAIGGYTDPSINYISPTVIDNCGWDDPSMGEEIFGPVLPVIEYCDLQTEVIDKVKEGEKPLSLYIFTRKRREVREILSQVSFGGGCVNETVMHIGNENLPFGGVGNSGMGAYHGKTSFATFSHQKSILYKSSWLNFDLLKPPYGKKLRLIRKVYK